MLTAAITNIDMSAIELSVWDILLRLSLIHI